MFHAEFLIRLSAYPSVRTEPQSDIGHKRGKNPFCSMTVPNSGTSMVDLRLMCGRLHCHVSAARSPRLATSAKASKLGCSRRGGHLL